MPASRSIHIGVNSSSVANEFGVSPLSGAVNDATTMSALAESAGIQQRLLLTEEAATVARVKVEILDAINAIGSDGFLMISFAGHGVRDYGHDDEAYVLSDGVLCDNCMAEALSTAASTAHILLVLDCCHARGMVMLDAQMFVSRSLDPRGGDEASRSLDALIATACTACETIEPEASILVLAACGPMWESGEDEDGGYFTRALADGIRSGITSYAGLEEFTRAELLRQRMPRPVFTFFEGRDDPAFWANRPLAPL